MTSVFKFVSMCLCVCVCLITVMFGNERVNYTLNIHIIDFVIMVSYTLELTYLTISFIYTILNVRLITTITKTNIFYKKLLNNLIIYHQTPFFKKIKSFVMLHLDICYKFKFILI